MKKSKYKIIKVTICIFLLLMLLFEMSIVCDIHDHLFNCEECAKCMLISNIQKLINNIFVTEIIIILCISVNIIRKVIENIIHMNLVWMKIRLNE